MSSSMRFFVLPKKKNFMLMNKGSPFFKYTFLQSSSLYRSLRNNNNGSNTQQIRQLLDSDFTAQDILNKSFLKDAIIDQESYKQQLRSRMALVKSMDMHMHIQNLISHNIIDIDIWKTVFHQVLWTEFKQYEKQQNFKNILYNMAMYMQKFPAALHTFKFNIEKGEIHSIAPFKNIFTSIFQRKSKIVDLGIELSLFKLVTLVSTKTDLNFKGIRNYYTNNISELPRLLEGENLETLIMTNKLYRHFGINTPQLNCLWKQRAQPLLENANQFSSSELRGMMTTDLLLQAYRQKEQEIIDSAKKHHLESMLLNSIVANHLQTKDSVDRILEGIQLQKLNNIRKNSFHQSIHNLVTRGYSMQKYKSLQSDLAKECFTTHPELVRIINKNTTPKSFCLSPRHNNPIKKDVIHNNVQRWYSSVIKQYLSEKYLVLVGSRLCQYEIDILLIDKEENIYAIQIKGSHYTDQSGELRNWKSSKVQFLRHYGINTIFLSTSQTWYFSLYKNRRQHELIALIQQQISKIKCN